MPYGLSFKNLYRAFVEDPINAGEYIVDDPQRFGGDLFEALVRQPISDSYWSMTHPMDRLMERGRAANPQMMVPWGVGRGFSFGGRPHVGNMDLPPMEPGTFRSIDQILRDPGLGKRIKKGREWSKQHGRRRGPQQEEPFRFLSPAGIPQKEIQSQALPGYWWERVKNNEKYLDFTGEAERFEKYDLGKGYRARHRGLPIAYNLVNKKGKPRASIKGNIDPNFFEVSEVFINPHLRKTRLFHELAQLPLNTKKTINAAVVNPKLAKMLHRASERGQVNLDAWTRRDVALSAEKEKLFQETARERRAAYRRAGHPRYTSGR